MERTSDRRDLDILVVGELNPDIIVSDPDPTPRFGQVERIVGDIRMTIGSSSAIFACGCARLGLRVAFVGVVGDDPFGRYMLQALAERGIETDACVVRSDRPTGATVVLSGPDDRAILTSLGTATDATDDLVADALLRRARHLHVGSWFLQAALRPRAAALFRRAGAAGLSTSLDCNWDPTEAWGRDIDAVLAETDLFFPNAEEARRLTGLSDDAAAALELARRSGGRAAVAVKRGTAGALIGWIEGGPDGTDRLVTTRAIPAAVVDTTGAGDAFDAGFVAGRLAGDDLADALRFAVACGSLSTRAIGGTEGQPTRAEAEAAVAAALETLEAREAFGEHEDSPGGGR